VNKGGPQGISSLGEAGAILLNPLLIRKNKYLATTAGSSIPEDISVYILHPAKYLTSSKPGWCLCNIVNRQEQLTFLA